MLADQPARDVEVRQVGAALVGVIEDEDVAGSDAPGEFPADLGHRVGDGAEVKRQRQALGDQPPLRVAEGAGHVHGVLEVVRIGGAHQRDGHLVHDGVEAVLHQLEENGIAEITGAHSAPPVVMTMLPCASRCAAQPGGTRVVASFSSTSSGPGRGVAVSCPRVTTAVTMAPWVGPK